MREDTLEPIQMLLWCPECGTRHVDEGEFATKRHHTHACQECGMVWRPAIVATCGVRFLPGFKGTGLFKVDEGRTERIQELRDFLEGANLGPAPSRPQPWQEKLTKAPRKTHLEELTEQGDVQTVTSPHPAAVVVTFRPEGRELKAEPAKEALEEFKGIAAVLEAEAASQLKSDLAPHLVTAARPRFDTITLLRGSASSEAETRKMVVAQLNKLLEGFPNKDVHIDAMQNEIDLMAKLIELTEKPIAVSGPALFGALTGDRLRKALGREQAEFEVVWISYSTEGLIQVVTSGPKEFVAVLRDALRRAHAEVPVGKDRYRAARLLEATAEQREHLPRAVKGPMVDPEGFPGSDF